MADDLLSLDVSSSLTAYPAGGYWALPPAARLRMLRTLCDDALDTGLIRRARQLPRHAELG